MLFAAGMFLGVMAAALYTVIFPSGSYTGEIEGRITDASYSNGYGVLAVKEGVYSLELDSLIVNGEEMRGKASLTLPFYVRGDMSIGDYIRFNGNLQGAQFDAAEYDSLMSAKYGVYYTAQAESDTLVLISGELTVAEQVRFAVRSALLDNCNTVTANFLYAMIFGDISYLEYSVAQPFRDTGTAHLFAVSGLHVALLFYACSAILSKIRMPKMLSFGIDCFILMGYSALCSFSPSVVRSAIMIIITIVCKYSYEKYDALSACGISASILLLCAPYFLLDAGFLMSYGAVFGIIGTMKPVARTLRKVIWRPIADAISVTICSNLGLLPLMLRHGAARNHTRKLGRVPAHFALLSLPARCHRPYRDNTAIGHPPHRLCRAHLLRYPLCAGGGANPFRIDKRNIFAAFVRILLPLARLRFGILPCAFFYQKGMRALVPCHSGLRLLRNAAYLTIYSKSRSAARSPKSGLFRIRSRFRIARPLFAWRAFVFP